VTFTHYPGASWRTCDHPGLLAEFLRRLEASAANQLTRLNPRLRVRGNAVYNEGREWFWGVPFFPAPDVHSSEVPGSFENFVAASIRDEVSVQDLVGRLLGTGSFLHNLETRDVTLRFLFALGGETPRPSDFIDRLLLLHPDGGVRATAVGLLALHAGHAWAQRRLARLTHDIDDRVFLNAFRAIGALRLSSALPDLLHIILSPAALVEMGRRGQSANPVGLGGAHALLAILQIAGTDDPREIRRAESEYPKSAALASEQYESLHRIAPERPLRARIPAPAAKIDLAMIHVPGGSVPVGLERGEASPGWFKHTNFPRRDVSLNSFAIARDPITNEVYDAFLEDFRRRGGPPYEHPLQPPGKDHTRATFGDPRFGPDHPVCGVDWFDAFAFCCFYGVRLPTEDEWEWAVTGPHPTPAPRAHGFEAVYGNYEGMFNWARRLNETTAGYPASTTAPVDASSTVGFGLRHALGNVWEYTDTNWCTKQSMANGLPAVRLTPEQYMSLHPYHVVIRGGAWTSVGDLLHPRYRGLDLLSDRHCEIGFRVVARS
jgi:formylglycine-generating enzyme required for sulfatase activity